MTALALTYGTVKSSVPWTMASGGSFALSMSETLFNVPLTAQSYGVPFWFKPLQKASAFSSPDTETTALTFDEYPGLPLCPSPAALLPLPPARQHPMRRSCQLARELFFQRDRSEPPAITRSRSRAAYYLTPTRLGHMVGMRASSSCRACTRSSQERVARCKSSYCKFATRFTCKNIAQQTLLSPKGFTQKVG